MKIAVFVHHPVCSVDSANGVMLSLEKHYTFKLFSKDEVEETFFDDVDIICIPGGIGDADRFDSLMEYNYDHIRNFVNRGGKYLGICMGAYWAGKYYLNILKNIEPVQYIKQPDADTKRPHPKAISTSWLGKEERMYFYDGCTFIGHNINSIAQYANTDPMAIQQGNVGLIGCHPESQKYWYNKKYLLPHWHAGHHNNLLLNFVNNLAQANPTF